MAQVVASLIAKIGADTSGFTSAAGGVKKSLLSLATNYLSVTAAIAAFGQAIKFSVDQAAEAELVDARLNAVLASTNYAAGLTADELDRMAKSLSNVSMYDDEAIKSSEALLLTFTKIGEDVFPTAQQAILDMSAALGQDLQSSTLQLGKALNDPIAGITALKRAGVSFTEEQKDMIKVLVENGDTLGAQKLILQELSTEFGGQAATAAKTYTGQIAQLKNELGNLGEAIGSDALPELTEFVTETKNAVVWATDNYEAIKKWVNVIMWMANPLEKGAIELGGFFRHLAFGNDETEDAIELTSGLSIRMQDLALYTSDTTMSFVDQDAAAKTLTDTYNGLISGMMDMQNETDRFNETEQDVLETMAAANGEFSSGRMKQEEYDAILNETTQKLNENAEAHRRWAAQTIFAFAQARAAADGNISQGEGDILIAVGQQLGLFDEQTATAMTSVNSAFDSLDASNAEEVIGTIRSALDTIIGTHTIDINVNVSGDDVPISPYDIDTTTPGRSSGGGGGGSGQPITLINYGGDINMGSGVNALTEQFG